MIPRRCYDDRRRELGKHSRASYWLAIAMTLATAWPACAKQASAGEAGPAIVLVDESGKSIAIERERLAKLPRKQVAADDRDGKRHTWEGPLLGDVLESADVPLGKALRGPRVALYVVVDAADGYRAVFALAEIDPTNSDTSVILADRRDGSPMDSREGPLRIIAPQEKRHARWVRHVTRLIVASPCD